jgi:hypothetical protein
VRPRRVHAAVWFVAAFLLVAALASQAGAFQGLPDLVIGCERIHFPANRGSDTRIFFSQLDQLDQGVSDKKAKSSDPDLSSRQRRGVKEVRRLASEFFKATDSHDRQELQKLLSETILAIDNNQRPPFPTHMDAFTATREFFWQWHMPIGRGTTPAANLDPSQPNAAADQRDPVPSTFWKRPANIAGQDLALGFGRSRLLEIHDQVWTYSAAKESYGRNPGYEVESEGTTLKLKFAELSSEAFANRIFHALGYHVDETDYAPEVKVRYSRRIFEEFNSRKPLKIQFTFLHVIPFFSIDVQEHYDPFKYLKYAVLKDGARWTGQELKTRLLDRSGDRPVYREDIESNIDYIVTVAANVQPKNPRLKSIGPWDFAQLDHPELRELRGVGLLAAWVGWFDCRFDNTRLRVLKTSGDPEIVHCISDLGGVLGETSGFVYMRGELPNAFPWRFTKPPLNQGPQRLSRPLRIYGYRPIARNPAFERMTIDDARWMARLIGRLSESQILSALIASGYDAAESKLYLEKLVSRRDEMIHDLGLAGEVGLLRAHINQNFNYDPSKDGTVKAMAGGKEWVAPVTSNRVVNGRLQPLRGHSCD